MPSSTQNSYEVDAVVNARMCCAMLKGVILHVGLDSCPTLWDLLSLLIAWQQRRTQLGASATGQQGRCSSCYSICKQGVDGRRHLSSAANLDLFLKACKGKGV